MKNKFHNRAVAILCLALFAFVQLAGSAGAVICIKTDGRTDLELGCECKEGRPSHSGHVADRNQVRSEEMAPGGHSPCNDIFITANALIQTPNNRGQRGADLTVYTHINIDGPASISQDVNGLVFPPLIVPEQIPEYISFTILVV